MANEIVVNKDLNGTKEVVDRLMGKMGFSMAYENSFEAIAQRGNAAMSAMMGPFAGKDKIAVKFKVSYREAGGKTSVFLEDAGSGLGKALTLTGGTTKKVLGDVVSTLREGISREGLTG